ncbi:hypothetical protein [Actinopolymorpha rutila]|uniref:Uncharacterized protein n=1 Tax=Actinopolymorpha rutila TaxID=446787 RepID=A0A852ZRD9_9ACTN|nr:hypothetical protein [Actinopolymorpha rutila]NYH91590.1 hypothetical protein [Actinopolymorpha rutila]
MTDATRETTYQCPTCRRLELFVQPQCEEGHGEGCPDWACVICGTALFVDTSFADGEQVEVERVRGSKAPRVA